MREAAFVDAAMHTLTLVDDLGDGEIGGDGHERVRVGA
jgi:hypothetical protein